jgi:putative tryptophan/tyrosine transport system substrate-binding protein
MWNIGFLIAAKADQWKPFTDAFETQLKSHLKNGEEFTIEYQEADGLQKLYTKIAKDFANPKRTSPIDIIVTGGTGAILACKKETSKIPIVFATAGDPVNSGLVASKPTGNLTGISNQQINLVIKRLNYMRDNLVPDWGKKIHLSAIGNDSVSNVQLEKKIVADVARDLGLKFRKSPPLKTQDDIEPVITKLKRQGVNTLFICTDPLITTNASIINKLAMDNKLGTMHAFRINYDKQGLMFYGPRFADMFKRAADFSYEILSGSKRPADIPIEEARAFESKCNKKIAGILGLKSLVATL